MFAIRRSYFLLPCFNVSLLTCYLLVFGNVSSMSLERHRRQFQQQNDKQLDISELVLPGAEGEMLQSDMELVPAIDGNSDMYLLVPASAAASQEQSLQSLLELSDNHKSDNIERNSDMLMQESEDTPASQMLELPANGMETSIHDELVAKNEISEETPNIPNESFGPVSERLVNTIIAEAADKIQNDIETELDSNETENRKTEVLSNAEISNSEIEEQENPEQEMIGVVLEEPNETIETESLLETEKHAGNQQIDLQYSEHFDNQQVKDNFNNFSQVASDQGHSADNENTESNENSTVGETQTENSDETKNEKGGLNEASAETNENYNHIHSLEQDNTKVESPSDDETRDVMELHADNQGNLHSQEREDYTLEGSTSEDKIKATEEHHFEEEPKPSGDHFSDVRYETEMKLGEISTEKIGKETEKDIVALVSEAHAIEGPITGEHIQFNNETPDKIDQVQDEVQGPSKETIKLDSVLSSDSLLFTGPENAEEYIKQEGDIKESQQDDLKDLNEPSQVQQMISESFIEENPTSAEQFEKDKPSEDQNKKQDEMQSIINSHDAQEIVENEHVTKILPSQDENVEHNESSEEIHQSVESQDAGIENAEVEEDIQSNEELQYSEEDKITEYEHSIEDNNKAEEIPENSFAQTEASRIESSQVLEEVHFGDEIETTSVDLQPIENDEALESHHSLQAHKPADEIQFSEPNHAQSSTEDAITSTETFQTTEETENEQSVEGVGSFDSADLEHSFEEEMKIKEQQIEAVNIKDDEILKSDEPPTEMESSPEETIQEDDYAPSLLLPVAEQQTEVTEFSVEQGAELVAKPAEISTDEIASEENVGQINAVANESTLQNIDSNQNVLEQHTAIQIQKPLNNIDSAINYDTNESGSEKENTSMLATMTQAATHDELAQQQQNNEHKQEESKEQEQQPAVEETTLKPLNVLDSVLNYVNASFMNQMNNNNGDDRQQEIKNEQDYSSKLRRYDGAQVWRIVVQNDRERKFAEELQTKYDGQLWKEVKQEVDYLLKPQVLADAEQHVRAANLSRIVLIDNLQKVIEVENPPAEEIEELQNRKGSRLTWQAYHRLDDIHSYFDYMAKTYPDICSVELIGYSIEKRPLKILKISNGNASNPGIWIDGGMHAREWISPAVVTFIANQIIEGWDDLPAYMHNINWYVHAVANPDGYEYSHTTDRLWRKNMRSHGRACPGVDLNRNFGYKWGGKGTSANPCSQTYRGSKAFSEPETFYISKFISNFPRETFKAYLSFHSYGQYILYPWGYDYHITKDMADLDLVARQAGTIITKSTGAKFTVGSSANTLYPAAGGSDDWAKGIAGIKYSYTIEMGDTGRYGFVLPAEYIEPNGKNGFTVVETVAKAIAMGKTARRRKLKARKTH